MTTDPYAETDEWPTVPGTRPHGKDHPMNHPENQQQIAQRRRRNAAYAEAIRKNLAIPEEIGRWANVLAEVVVPVADQETAELVLDIATQRTRAAAAEAETAELRAEVERLRDLAQRNFRQGADLLGQLQAAEAERDEALAALARVRALADAFADDELTRHGGNIAWHIEEAITNEKGDFPDAADRRIASQRERAEAAEAESARLASVVANVEALVDDMDERGRPGIGDSPMDAQARRQIREDAKRLRAALASVGVSGSADDRREANASQAPDTATPGEVWLDIECGAKHPTRPSAVPCQRLAGHEGSHLSTTGCAGSVMHWPASSVDDKAGEQ